MLFGDVVTQTRVERRVKTRLRIDPKGTASLPVGLLLRVVRRAHEHVLLHRGAVRQRVQLVVIDWLIRYCSYVGRDLALAFVVLSVLKQGWWLSSSDVSWSGHGRLRNFAAV